MAGAPAPTTPKPGTPKPPAAAARPAAPRPPAGPPPAAGASVPATAKAPAPAMPSFQRLPPQPPPVARPSRRPILVSAAATLCILRAGLLLLAAIGYLTWALTVEDTMQGMFGTAPEDAGNVPFAIAGGAFVAGLLSLAEGLALLGGRAAAPWLVGAFILVELGCGIALGMAEDGGTATFVLLWPALIEAVCIWALLHPPARAWRSAQRRPVAQPPRAVAAPR